MNAPIKGPPRVAQPILVPFPREPIEFDRYNGEVLLDGPIWCLNDQAGNISLNWTALEFTHRGMVEATADFMVRCIREHSASTCKFYFGALQCLKKLNNFQRWQNPPVVFGNRPELTQTFFYEARDELKLLKGYLHVFREWMVFCAKREGSGVNKVGASILNSLSIGGDPKGVAVLSSDPERGPLNDAETTAVLQALSKAREEGTIPIKHLAAVWLCVILGPNPRMLSMMREEDFRRVDGVHPEMSVPRIKRKDPLGRTRFKVRKLDEYSARIIEDLIADNDAKRRENPWKHEGLGLALFPRRAVNLRQVDRAQHAYAMHISSNEISRMVRDTVTKLGVHSPRTGKTLAAGPRRFRYTFGARLLAEGASKHVVKELLDHTDYQTIRVYLNLRGDIVEKLDAATARELAPLAQAFMGNLVVDEADAVRGETMASRIFAGKPAPDEGVGTCGSFSFCGYAAPTACYTCFRFQAWVDGPHEKILADLLAQREERERRGLNGRLVSMNDNTILAVAAVVDRCEEARRARSASKEDDA